MPTSNQHSRPSATETQNLHDIIDSSTPSRLRAVIKNLIATSPANYAYVKRDLMLEHGTLKRSWSAKEEDDEDEEDEKSGNDYESDYSEEQNDIPASRQRFEICEQCGQEYDTLLNEKKSCVWHDGDQEVDWDGDFWADHDERCHGTIDTAEMRKDFPQGFVWSCCDKPGDAAGCKTSRHRPNRAKRVRR